MAAKIDINHEKVLYPMIGENFHLSFFSVTVIFRLKFIIP